MAQRLVRAALRSLAFAAATAAAAAGAGCGSEAPLPPLPDLPPMAGANALSVKGFREADAAARQAPRDPELVGSLGMRYHAYDLLEPARACYARARALAPGDFRWVYYGAMLEKRAFRYPESETLFLRALEMRPDDPGLHAELGDLYLMWGRRTEAARHLDEALRLDPAEPVAAVGRARLLSLEQKWSDVIDLLEPLLERYPRLSRAHKFLAAAHGALGHEERRARHQELGEYGSAVESPLMSKVHDLAVDAILSGDPSSGAELLRAKCARCHDHERIDEHDETRFWWGRTVRRMQREAGWAWLTDDEAAAVVAYLSERSGKATRPPPR